jgi:hypothetical protein
MTCQGNGPGAEIYGPGLPDLHDCHGPWQGCFVVDAEVVVPQGTRAGELRARGTGRGDHEVRPGLARRGRMQERGRLRGADELGRGVGRRTGGVGVDGVGRVVGSGQRSPGQRDAVADRLRGTDDRLAADPTAEVSTRAPVVPCRVSVSARQPCCQDALTTAVTVPFWRKTGAPASPLQASALLALVGDRVVAMLDGAVNWAAWAWFGTHSLCVRPQPATVRFSVVPGVPAVAARGSVVTSVILVSMRARATSRSERTIRLVTFDTCPSVPDRSPRPTVTVVCLAGVPPCGFSGKQLAAVRTSVGSTSAPLHARPSMLIFAAKPYVPAAPPETASAGTVVSRSPTSTATARADTWVVRLRIEVPSLVSIVLHIHVFGVIGLRRRLRIREFPDAPDIWSAHPKMAPRRVRWRSLSHSVSEGYPESR